MLASHDMAEVETLCDRLAILHDGAVAFIGTVPELAKKAGARHTIRIRTDLGEEIHQSGDIGVDLLALLEDLKRRAPPCGISKSTEGRWNGTLST